MILGLGFKLRFKKQIIANVRAKATMFLSADLWSEISYIFILLLDETELLPNQYKSATSQVGVKFRHKCPWQMAVLSSSTDLPQTRRFNKEAQCLDIKY